MTVVQTPRPSRTQNEPLAPEAMKLKVGKRRNAKSGRAGPHLPRRSAKGILKDV